VDELINEMPWHIVICFIAVFAAGVADPDSFWRVMLVIAALFLLAMKIW